MKPIWKTLIVAAVIIAVGAALFVIPHFRAKAALRKYREQLIAKGEKLTIAEMTPVLSAEATTAGRELTAVTVLTPTFTNSPPMMKWLAPGHALVGWAETDSPTENLTNCWPEFSAMIKGRPEIAAQMAAALQKSEIGFNVQYQMGFSALLPHLAYLKRGSIWLAGAATLALHEQDYQTAWNDLDLETELLRKYGSEPLMICQLVRASMTQISLASTWEALQRRGWSEEQLARLQTNWDSFNLLDHAAAALAMERGMQAIAFDQMRGSLKIYEGVDDNAFTGYDSFNDVLANPQNAVPGFLGKYPRYWMWRWSGSYDEELFMAQVMQAAIETMRSVARDGEFTQRLDDFRLLVSVLEQIHPGAKQRFVFARRLSNAVHSYMKRMGEMEMAREMLVTALALERFHLQHGNYPERLEDLTPDFLKKAPVDFMDGKPLRYQRNEDGTYLMYSVGLDGKDDGGDGTPVDPEGMKPRVWSRMRDAVWPSPATAEEVKKSEAEMLQKYSQKWPRGNPPPQVPPPKRTTKTN